MGMSQTLTTVKSALAGAGLSCLMMRGAVRATLKREKSRTRRVEVNMSSGEDDREEYRGIEAKVRLSERKGVKK
jgi:hypothetical protein